MAQELGFGICPWSPLASGLLTGKYKRDDTPGAGRLSVIKGAGNPIFEQFTERNWKIIDASRRSRRSWAARRRKSRCIGRVTQPGMTSVIIGATKMEQLEKNLASLDLYIPGELRKKLDAVTRWKKCIRTCSSASRSRIAFAAA